MAPNELRTIFWDVDWNAFDPAAFPDYTIFRILEFGDEDAVRWMRQTFSDAEVRRVLMSERRLTRKSANYWALVYGIPEEKVLALRKDEQPQEPS